jgi:acetylornithine/succinyldiaminopimelate/putrescine aminotransferase/predicted amino acid dehydrogenase
MNIQLSELAIPEDTAAKALAEEYGIFCRPWLIRLLAAIGLDVVYERAEQNYLWHSRDGQPQKILDFAGGFGSTLFGHNHPVLINEAQKLLKNQVPVMVQGSCRGNAARLAKKLCQKVGGDYVTIFTNSGAETVEAAMKHARLETGRTMFWAIRGAFHGKTLGAIQMTDSYRQPFEGWGPEVRFLDPQNPEDWALALAESGEQVAAIFVEPILGEGGIRPLPASFAQWLNQQSKILGVPLIADEIQVGMGRTGTFLASSTLGLEPDYICLAKSLGGGLTKIGALMIKRQRFVDEFSVIHTSTFAEDDFSCGIALKALELLDTDEIPARCLKAGTKLLSKLKALQARFPNQIEEVRGQGLMIGIELVNQPDSASNIIKMLSQQQYLGWIAAGYLLNVHNIRITPTLNRATTLRIQPSAYIDDKQIDRLLTALEMFCQAVEYSDAGHLTRYQVGLRDMRLDDWRELQPSNMEMPNGKRQVAFIGHFLSARDVALCDVSISTFPENLLDEYVSRTSPVVGPSVTDRINVRSITGDEVHIRFLGLNLTALQISQARQQRQLGWIREKIEAGAVLAKDLGCQVVGFGGYTSSVTGNCRRVRTKGIALTSGNSLTIGMALEALKHTALEAGIELKDVPVAVVGAPGNIASIAAIMLAAYASELTLIQRSGSSHRVDSLIERIRAIRPGIKINLTDDLYSLKNAKLILTATISGESFIKSEHISQDTTVICDVAVPHDVLDEVLHERPNTTIIDGGIVRLPCNENFSIAGIPLQQGRVFACMAETLLMGLEGFTEHGTYGDITPEGVEQMLALATKHGFTLDTVKRKKLRASD